MNDDDKPININKVIFGKNKKFDIDLYNKYDIPARNIVKECLNEYVEDNPDIYAEDMILKIPEYKYKYLELQVCTTWLDNSEYPHKNPYIYERKKFFSEDTLFVIFNKSMTKLLLFNKKAIFDKPKRRKKYSRQYIYEIHWHKVLPMHTDELDYDMLLSYPQI